MTLRTYIILFSLATVIAWVGWLFILIQVNPFEAESLWIVAFYVSLAIALFGFFSLIGFFFRVWFSDEQRLFRHLSVSSRQGGLLSFLTVMLLFFQANGYLYWWNIILLLLAVVLFELFFLSKTTDHS